MLDSSFFAIFQTAVIKKGSSLTNQSMKLFKAVSAVTDYAFSKSFFHRYRVFQFYMPSAKLTPESKITASVMICVDSALLPKIAEKDLFITIVPNRIKVRYNIANQKIEVLEGEHYFENLSETDKVVTDNGFVNRFS